MLYTPETPTFDSFYTRYLPVVRHTLGGLRGQSREQLDDLVQETFVRAWKAYDRLDHSQNVAAWISQIARRVASSFFRHLLHGMDQRQPPVSSTREIVNATDRSDR